MEPDLVDFVGLKKGHSTMMLKYGWFLIHKLWIVDGIHYVPYFQGSHGFVAYYQSTINSKLVNSKLVILAWLVFFFFFFHIGVKIIVH